MFSKINKNISRNLTTYFKWLLALPPRCKKSSFGIFLVNLQSHTRWNLFSRNYVARVVTFILLLFPKLFAGAVHLCQTMVVTRAYRPYATFTKLVFWNTDRQTEHISAELIAFVGRGLLKSNYSPRSYLRTAPAAAGRGLPRVYLTEASGRRAVDSQRK